MTVFLQLRAGSSGPVFKGENESDTLLWSVAEAKFYVGPSPGGGAVLSVFARVGNVVAQSGDYDSDQVDNESSVAGASVSDALESLQAEIGALDSDEIANVSGVAGVTVSDALDTLEGEIAALPAALTWGAYVVLNVVGTTPFIDFTATQNTIVALSTPGGASDFLLASNGDFALGAGCVLTYSGPACVALISCSVSFYFTGANGFCNVGVSHNGDLIGQTPIGDNVNLVRAGFTEQYLVGGTSQGASFLRRVALNPGDTLQLVGGFDTTGGTADPHVVSFQMLINLEK